MVISIGIMFQNNGIMFNFSRKMLSFFYLYTNFVDGKMKIHRKNGYFYKKNASDKSIMKESENLWKLMSLVSILNPLPKSFKDNSSILIECFLSEPYLKNSMIMNDETLEDGKKFSESHSREYRFFFLNIDKYQ